jgi:hypothetical protein
MNPNIEFFRRLHAVAKAIVDSGSADADTVAELETATLELVGRYTNPQYALKQIYSADTELSSLLRQAVAIVNDGDNTEEFEKARPRDGAAGAHGLAAALSEHLIDRLSRLRQQHGFEKKESTPMESIEKLKAERTQNLLAIGKAGGAVAMAKIINADNDAHGLSEEEYTRILTEHAQKLYPAKTPDSAFATVFSDTGADGVLLRKAHAVVVKAAPFDIKPTMVGGPDATHEASDDTESSEAYAQLVSMAEKMRVASPELSAAQSFERVFTDKRNAGLAASAHRRPTPPVGGAYPHPR